MKNKLPKEEEGIIELVAMQKKVLAGGIVPNFEYKTVLKKLRSFRRGNWRVFDVRLVVEAQSDWSVREVKEHLEVLFEDSLLRRYSIKVKVAK